MIGRVARYVRYSALCQIVLSRVRDFLREPEAVFWVYGFPILLTVGLGIAFRNQPLEQITVDVVEGPGAKSVLDALSKEKRFDARILDERASRIRLRTGTSSLVVSATDATPSRYDYLFDSTRQESILARNTVDDALQRALGRTDPASVTDVVFNEPGGRYIDFLVPGLLGMSIMGGGLWGVGFVTVDMRIRKLLKRFLATPMKKSQFLGGIMISRMLFLFPEVFLLLVFARLIFGVKIYGSVLAIGFLIVLGAVAFSGLGLLVASRANTVETVSGLMNLVMLPMWLLSGIFFSSDRFPSAVQPAIQLLPLTPLIGSLRHVMLEEASLASQASSIAIMAVWATVTFALALCFVPLELSVIVIAGEQWMQTMHRRRGLLRV